MPKSSESDYQLLVVAAMLEVSPRIILSYERRGLVQSHLRGGRKHYSATSVCRIRRIISATQLGVNLPGAEVVCNLLERLEQQALEIQILREQVARALSEIE